MGQPAHKIDNLDGSAYGAHERPEIYGLPLPGSQEPFFDSDSPIEVQPGPGEVRGPGRAEVQLGRIVVGEADVLLEELGVDFDSAGVLKQIVYELASEDDKFPEIKFELRADSFVDGAIFDASPGSRLREAMRALEAAAPEVSEKSSSPDDSNSPETAGNFVPVEHSLQQTKKYLSLTRQINGQKYRSDSLLDQELVLAELKAVLSKHNDPTVQLLNEVRDRFGGKMETGAFTSFRANFLIVAKQHTVRAIYRAYFKEFMSALKKPASQ